MFGIRNFFIKLIIMFFHILMLILGLVGILSPDAFSTSFGYIAGSFLTVIGILFILYAFLSKVFGLSTILTSIGGSIALFSGIIFFVFRHNSLDIVGIILMIGLFMSAFSKIFGAYRYYKFNITTWWITLLIGLTHLGLAITLACFVGSHEGILSVLMGSFLIVGSVSGIISVISKVIAEKRNDDVLDTIFTKEKKKDKIDIDFTK